MIYNEPPSGMAPGIGQLVIECGTCLAGGTTACNDCVVTHLLANDDGPIGLTTVDVRSPDDSQRHAVELLCQAGLLDHPIEFVPVEIFDALAREEARSEAPTR